MNELSERAREVIRTGVGTFRPAESDRERVLVALRARLGNAALPTIATDSSRALGLKRWLWPGLSLLTLGAVGAALFLLSPTRKTSQLVSTPPAAAAVAVTPSATWPAAAVPAEAALAPPASGAAVVAPSSPSNVIPGPVRHTSDQLAQEVAQLSTATLHLNAGRAAAALEALEEHRRKFPNGVLTEERRGARAQALCLLGRREEAERELTRLARAAPQSPHLLQARKVCEARRTKK